MSFSAIWHRRLKYMLTPQFDLYARIGERFCGRSKFGDDIILDYGCGTGFGAIRLRPAGRAVVVGVDCDQDAVAFAESVLGNMGMFVLADATDERSEAWMRIKDGSIISGLHFTLVTLIEVIEHMKIDVQDLLIKELSSVLAPIGGSPLVVSTPNKRSQFRKHGGHVGMHDPASLRDLLAPHFESVAFEDYLGEPLADDTTISPLVAICRGPR